MFSAVSRGPRGLSLRRRHMQSWYWKQSIYGNSGSSCMLGHALLWNWTQPRSFFQWEPCKVRAREQHALAAEAAEGLSGKLSTSQDSWAQGLFSGSQSFLPLFPVNPSRRLPRAESRLWHSAAARARCSSASERKCRFLPTLCGS